ncbi:MAG: 3-oxoadipate enol-lactonase [Sphingomonadales bacterium]
MTVSSFLADDGCRIAYRYQPKAGKPVLVLSPSLGTAMALFDLQLPALESAFSVLCYDPRGHGASDVPQGACSMDRLGRDVLNLLDHLQVERAHFAGVSLGGMTGQWLGYRAPERIGALILANTSACMGPPSGWTDRINLVLQSGMAVMVEAVLERWFTANFRTSGTTAIQPVRAMLEATAPQGYAGCCAAIRDMDLRPTASLISCPSLVIAGLQDPATPPAHAEFLARTIPGAKLVELDAAHLSNVELPDQFSAAVVDFLGDQP